MGKGKDKQRRKERSAKRRADVEASRQSTEKRRLEAEAAAEAERIEKEYDETRS